MRDYWTWQVERTKKQDFEPWQEMQRTEVQIFTGNKSRQERERIVGEDIQQHLITEFRNQALNVVMTCISGGRSSLCGFAARAALQVVVHHP